MTADPTALPVVTVHRSTLQALRLFNADRLYWLDRAADAGPLSILKLGPAKAWVVSDPDLAREMLIQNGLDWERPPAAVLPIRLGIGENLFTQADTTWRLLQPYVQPSFRRRALAERLSSMSSIIGSSVDQVPTNVPVDVELQMGALAVRLAAWVLFGYSLTHESALDISAHQNAVVQWVGKRLGQLRCVVPFAPGASGRAMRAHRRVLEGHADQMIAHGRGRADLGADTMGLLLAARPGGRSLTADELRSHVLGLLLAGNETTAASLTWSVVHGARHPDEWKRLRSDPSRSRAFVEETLRLTPAVWGFARRPKRRGVSLNGRVVGRSDVVTLNIRGVNRAPSRWSDPLDFRPDRHIGTAEAPMLNPFGLGERSCIGHHLAIAEMEAILPHLARHGQPVIDHPIVEDPSFALRVKGGVRATWT